jgi:hypothetical protein
VARDKGAAPPGAPLLPPWHALLIAPKITSKPTTAHTSQPLWLCFRFRFISPAPLIAH